MEEWPAVNRWISKAEGRTLSRHTAEPFGLAPAEAGTAIQTIADPNRLERMTDRIFDPTATGWLGLRATP